MKPKCQRCGTKPVRKLASLGPGYRNAEYFCSMACAAKAGLDGPMDNNETWCEKHLIWWDGNEYEECWQCHDEVKALEEREEKIRVKQLKEATADG